MADVKTADAVVIGGGARGCSIALYLARAGVRVVLVERRVLSDLSTGGNGAQVNVSAKEPDHYTAVSLRSARMYPEFIATAVAEGNRAAQSSFEKANAVEQTHHGLYAEALEAAKAGKDLPEADLYICDVCGHTVVGAPPDICPVCGARHEKFGKVE